MTKCRKRRQAKGDEISDRSETREWEFPDRSVAARQHRLATRGGDAVNIMSSQMLHRKVDRIGQSKQCDESRETVEESFKPSLSHCDDFAF